MQSSLPINRAIDINKLLAFLRAGAPATFLVKEELRDLVIKALKEFARSHRITVRYVEPGREKLIICSAAGLMAGAGAGAVLAGIAGALAGAGVGLAVGYACAHVSVSISPLADGQPGFTVDTVHALNRFQETAMTTQKKLSLVDVIHRTANHAVEDVGPLLKYLDFKPDASDLTSRSAAQQIADHLRRMGSNDIASLFRGGDGVSYAEVVCDVGEKLKAKDVSSSNTVERNEGLVIEKVFADTLDSMSPEEKRVLFRSMNLDAKDVPYAASAAVLMPILLRQLRWLRYIQVRSYHREYGVASLVGSGLSFATNAVITRSIGTLLGPIGWIASGAWLAVDLAGPAFRKTVPAVLYTATLRLALANRLSIGVVGDGSTGKDTLIEKVFGIPTNADPVAGSTSEVMRYALGGGGDAFVTNYPGFNDYRARVNASTDDALHHTDVFLLVMDATRGISGTDVALCEKVRAFGKPVLVCLNKWDLIRTEKDGISLMDAARKRLKIERIQGPDVPAQEAELVLCALDPLPALGIESRGASEVREWVKAKLQTAGKNESLLDEF